MAAGAKLALKRPEKMLIGRRTHCLLAAAVLGCASAALGQTIPSAINSVTVRPQATPTGYYTTDVTVPVEDNYIPNVVWRENGAASYQALKVQAVAARGYMDYKLSQTPNGGKQTFVYDGTSNQVYSKTGTAPLTRATATTSTQQSYFRATDETEREFLMTSAGEPVCMFYVAGGKPDTSTDPNTIWPMGAPLGQWETGDSDPTGTEHYVTYNRGLTGTSIQPTTLGSLSNPVNRGAMSQNGSNFLGAGRTSGTAAQNFAAWDYVDIIKYYYGQDTQLALAKVPSSGELPAFVKQIASFDYDEGYLRNRMDYSATNSTNILYRS